MANWPPFSCPYSAAERRCELATWEGTCNDATLIRCPLHPTKYDLALLPGYEDALDQEKS